MRVVGLMSGTSLDGIDAALIEVAGDSVNDVSVRVVHAVTLPYPAERRASIHDAILAGSAAGLCRMNAERGEWLAEAAARVCADARIPVASLHAIGSHGQTVWHVAPENGTRGATLQLGDPATIAERTGRPVVSDFRSRDVA